MENPFQETLIQKSRAEPCTVVIFGATGDLTHRKLIPALYNIAAAGDLPPQFKVVGFARRDKSDAVFREELEAGNKKHSRQPHTAELWSGFEQSIHYHQSEFQDLEGYQRLSQLLDQFDSERGASANRLFYLASAPEFSNPSLNTSKPLDSIPRPQANGREWCVKNPLAKTSPPPAL
jgi:glucose-6-phosphate 1-dehydrogenase